MNDDETTEQTTTDNERAETTPAGTAHTVASLKAMPLAARYDALREIVESGGDIGEDSLKYVLPALCLRKTWPKGREHPTLSGYGRANRWNFKEGPHPIGESRLPPSLAATSPDALYRLMHVVRPSRIVTDPSDYYKGGVFRFYSADRRYLCWVGFHKCEVELSFYCPQGDLFVPEEPEFPREFSPPHFETHEELLAFTSQGGTHDRLRAEHPGRWEAYRDAQDAFNHQGIIVPWSSGRMRCKRPAGQAWMRLVVAVASTPWMIYGGNNFKV